MPNTAGPIKRAKKDKEISIKHSNRMHGRTLKLRQSNFKIVNKTEGRP